MKQASIYEKLAASFIEKWYLLVKDKEILKVWEENYPDTIEAVKKKAKTKEKGKAKEM